MDGDHDLVQPVIHFFTRPRLPPAVLRHFQSRSGHAAGVGRRGRPIKDFRIEEKLRRLERARQVRAFGNQWDAVIDKRFRAAHVFSFCVALGNAQSALMLQIGLYGFR